ncbi:TetR/AcrR family transcriptional regulator [Bailinhaonella thermotolerans]|uniref:TetR/AcrR family transcriptional regulator n=1 Tax=Bailinhaonella thermotolerans TaxID=1070861 RepID=A0A3A4APZ6_9ACTN|nr:TetR/AcrR family transcriptional regulator [Bailinhaonella thermotolerans]RJL30495.1 TetR/AcrR family transcriptional regulator [Bailinhaonella thermotolerans]
MEDQPFPSVWTRPRRSGRAQPALSREQIVAEALRLLDSEGIEALSMRRLGAALNAGATSIYSHVSNKDELIELVIDEVYGEVEVPEITDPSAWREAAGALARELRATILRHPWIISVLDELGLSYMGPKLMNLSEGMLNLFEAAGFGLVEADQAGKFLLGYVLGTASTEAAVLTRLARTGWDERAWSESVRAAATALVRTHPRMSALYAAQEHREPDEFRESSFTYGLERALDGLEIRLRALRS